MSKGIQQVSQLLSGSSQQPQKACGFLQRGSRPLEMRWNHNYTAHQLLAIKAKGQQLLAKLILSKGVY